MTNSDMIMTSTCDVAIVGGGTAGLALASELKRQGVGTVVVIEREKSAGGIPRHCGHYPFGVREYKRLLKGPDYAARNVEEALKLGVEIRVQTTVSALHPEGLLDLTCPNGVEQLRALRVVLCTGVRESSRAQRFIGGERPLGVMSTGALQSMVYLNAMRPFKKPIILGSELVSFSAINTCRHLGMQVGAMVEEQSQIVTHQILQPYLTLKGVPLYTGAQNPRIIGSKRVEGLEFNCASGNLVQIETDGIIVSGRFRPESALLRASHLEVDSGTGGPIVDQFGQCSDPTYYSAGNLLRPAETSSWCWHEGVNTAQRIAQDLLGPNYETRGHLRLRVNDSKIQFALPQRLTITDRLGGMQEMQIGLREPVRGVLNACVGGACIWSSGIHSRPVRRIHRSLKAILDANPQADIKLSISPRT